MSQVKVIASLKPKSFGAPHMPLFTKEGQIELKPEMKDQTEMEFGGVTCLLDKYDQKEGVMYLQNYLSSVSKEYFAKLKTLGWKVNEARAREYGLPCT